MKSLTKLLTAAIIVWGAYVFLNLGYKSVTESLSAVVGQSYGAIGAQLEAGSNCGPSQACDDLQQTGHELGQINSRFQKVLNASKQ